MPNDPVTPTNDPSDALEGVTRTTALREDRDPRYLVAGPLPDKGRRFRAVINALFDAYYDWDIELGTVDFSAQLGSFLGIQPDVLGTIGGWADRIHPDDRSDTLIELQTAVEMGQVFTAEYRMQRADGSYALIRDRGITVRDESGRTTHLVGVMRDITKEREAERGLQEAAELYRTLFELALNPAFHVDREGRYVNANQAGASFLESTTEDLVGRTIGSHWGVETLEAVRRVLEDGQSAARLDAEARVGASTKAAILSLIPCRVGGELACFVLATDITERQTLARTLEESNIALRVILEQRDRSRDELERTVATNVENVVLPLLNRVMTRIEGAPEAVLLHTAVQNLQDIVRPFSPGLVAAGADRLTPREREIAHLIRAGKSSTDIAQALYISLDTVAFHRKNLRRKLGLGSRGPRLSSFLAGSPADDAP